MRIPTFVRANKLYVQVCSNDLLAYASSCGALRVIKTEASNLLRGGQIRNPTPNECSGQFFLGLVNSWTELPQALCAKSRFASVAQANRLSHDIHQSI